MNFMNKNTSIVVVIIALAIVGGIVYTSGKKDTPATVTKVTNTETNTTEDAPAVRTPDAPDVVTDSASFPTDSTAVLNGTINPNGAVTSYWYEYGDSSSLGRKTTGGTLGSGYGVIGAPGYLTSLSKDTTYYYRLVAENKYGKVAGAQYSFQTTHVSVPVVGSAPSVKTSAIADISEREATLKGEVNPHRAKAQYWFEYGTSSDLGETSATFTAGSGNTVVPVSVTIGNLEPLTKYYFRLNAQNQFGTVNGSTLVFKTEGPVASAPEASTKSASSILTTSAKLNASINPNGETTSYWFEYSDDSLLGGVLVGSTPQKSLDKNLGVTAVNMNIPNLSPNKTYYFRIIAQNSVGTSRGQILSFKTKAR